eukprot:TRINITY_DN1795_c0_g1_i1.p1 TRINITY_DN1795_c0_g1~~TRINITY_DN1795_c0_g1_i1.p1  ORF type:complete len:718 (+),score=172.54 TRINITY_DN1795_c0_g1_i1:29-2155(+)
MGGVESTEGGIKGVYGLQVGSLLPRSPASNAGLLPFFDFIVKVDTYELNEDSVSFFRDYLKKHLGSPVKLTVYNSKLLCLRELTLVPSDGWGGNGLLGCSLEWSNTVMSWHVTSINPESPLNGVLVAEKDFIIGLEAVPGDPNHPIITLFCDKDDFHSRLTEKMQLRLERRSPDKLLLLVYDNSDNTIREVYADLGRSPSLGIDVGNGYLHNIPPGKELPVVRSFIEFRDGQVAEGFTASDYSNAGQHHILPTAEQEIDKEEQQRLSVLFQAQQDHEKKKKEEEQRLLDEERRREAEAEQQRLAQQKADEEARRRQEQKEEEDRIRVQAEAELRKREEQLKLQEEQRKLERIKAERDRENEDLARQQQEILRMRQEHEAQMQALREQQEALKAQREQQEEMRRQLQQMQQEQLDEERRLALQKEALEARRPDTQPAPERPEQPQSNHGALPRADCRPSPVSVPSTGSLDQFPLVQPVRQYAPQLDALGQPAFPHSPIQFAKPHSAQPQAAEHQTHAPLGHARTRVPVQQDHLHVQAGHEPQPQLQIPSIGLNVTHPPETTRPGPRQLPFEQGQVPVSSALSTGIAEHSVGPTVQVGHEKPREAVQAASSGLGLEAQQVPDAQPQPGMQAMHNAPSSSSSGLGQPRQNATQHAASRSTPKQDLFDILTAGHTGGRSTSSADDFEVKNIGRRDSDFGMHNDGIMYPFYSA